MTRYFIRLLLVFALCMSLSAACTSESEETLVPPVTEVKIAPQTLTFTATGGTTTFSVQSPKRPQVSSEASWCSVREVESSSTITFKYAVSVEGFVENNDRKTRLVVDMEGRQLTADVIQIAADGLVVKTQLFEVEAAGGLIEVQLQTNGKFTATPQNEWIHAAITRADMVDYVASFTIDANPGDTRDGSISFTMNGITENVTIHQASGFTDDGIQATAMEIASRMYPGWNLGNTLEASAEGLGAETAWQPTRTTQEVIDFVAAQGFRCIRIPCNWYGHMDESHTIDAVWLNRVREVVDYCIKDSIYVVLNDHYDHGWLEQNIDPFDPQRDAILRTMWTQVANHFIGYDEHLLFAGLNEPNADSQEATDNLIRYEETFIDAVRSTGGNNTQRTLVVQGPKTNIDNTYDWYNRMPTDVAENRLMAEVHFYSPWNFCGMSEDASWGYRAFFWGADYHVEGSNYNATWGEEDYVHEQMQKMKTHFADRGIPVLIGEYAGLWREIAEHQDMHDASVQHYYEVVVREAIENGCVACAWDTNYCTRNGENGNSSIINRSDLTIFNPFAMKGIQEGTAAAKWPY